MSVPYHSFARVLITLLVGLLLAWGIVPVQAATTNVASQTELSAAITAANGGNIDTIYITAASITLTGSNLPPITVNGLTIEGNGNTISGGTDIRIFTIDIGADVTINNLTLKDGNCSGGCPIDTTSGGGIYNLGTATISNSTVSGNSATLGGGGIVNGGTLTLSNSTVSGNSASIGGGINNSAGTLTLSNSTVSGNSASIGGGIVNVFAGTLTLKNTLLSLGASGANCYSTTTILSNGATYNLADDTSCGTANVKPVAPLGLGTLGANGGLTQTIPLLVGSPAIDAGEDAVCAAAPVNGVDQRGTARPSGLHCDIGAFEYGAVPPAPPVVSSSAASAEPTAIPAPALCSLPGFPVSAQVALYLPNGGGLNVCNSLLSDVAQVGITDPFTLAAEVYTFDASGSVTTGVPVQVCLQGVGQLLYRDANGQPRITVNLPSFSQNGFTCGTIPHPGTVILIPGAPSPAAAAPILTLSQCRVTTTNILKLRSEPSVSSAVLDHVPYQTTLSASARSGEWLQVVFGSQQGWLSAAYLTLEGGCG